MKKKILLILILITLLVTSLFAADSWYEMFTAAMSYDLGRVDSMEHTGPWSTSGSGGNYGDKDMIGIIGSSSSDYGYWIKITPNTGMKFKTQQDFSAYRDFYIEFVLRGKQSNGGDVNLCTKTVNIANIGVSNSLGGSINRNWTFYTSGIYPVLKTDTSWYIRMPPSGTGKTYTRTWIDMVIVFPKDFDRGTLATADDYQASFLVEFFDIKDDGSPDTTLAASYNIILTGYYDAAQSGSSMFDYQFLITHTGDAEYFNFDDNYLTDDDIKVGEIYFSSESGALSKWGNNSNNYPTKYEISVGATPNYLETGQFYFKRIGTENKPNSDDNSINYIAKIKKDQNFNPVPTWNYKTYEYDKSNITGNEGYYYRRIQVPFYRYAIKAGVELYEAKYLGDIFIKVNSEDVKKLTKGVYRSTMYVHLVVGN